MNSKDEAIIGIVASILEMHPQLQVCDHWIDDVSAIGIISTSNSSKLLYISSFNKIEGFFDLIGEESCAESEIGYKQVFSEEDVNREKIFLICENFFELN